MEKDGLKRNLSAKCKPYFSTFEAIMTTATSANFELKIENKQLQIGSMKLPVENAKICWMDSNENLQLFCQSVKGPDYEARITLQLNNLDKVKECFKLLILNTSTSVPLPGIRSLKPDLGNVKFLFDDESNAQLFQIFYVPCFFPEEEFECKLNGNRCFVRKLGDTNPPDYIQRINAILQQLKLRAPCHEIDTLLFMNKDSRFPGELHDQKTPEFVTFDFEGLKLRSYIVTPESVHRSNWNKDGLRSEVPSSCEEIDMWINQRTPEQALRDKKCWESLYQELNAVQNSSYSPYILFIGEIIDNFGQFDVNSELTVQAIHPLFKMAEKNQQLRDILIKCFQ